MLKNKHHINKLIS